MGAGKPGLQGPRNDRRFPPLGVKAVASYSCATEKGGVAHQVAHQVAHAFDNPNAPRSEGGALAVVVQAVPGNPHWTWVGTDSPSPLRQSAVRRRPRASPPRTARRGAAREGEEVEGATPPFSALVRHRGGVSGPPFGPPLTPPLGGVAPSTVIPAGRLSSRPSGASRGEPRPQKGGLHIWILSEVREVLHLRMGTARLVRGVE